MKRDMELIRKILLALEERESCLAVGRLTIADHSDDEVGFHVRLILLSPALEMAHKPDAQARKSA